MSQTFSSIHCYPGMDSAMLDSAMDSAAGIVRESLGKFTHRFKSSNSFGGFFEPTENVEWTTGFWTGCIWLAYEHTGDPGYLPVLQKHLDSFFHRVEDPGYLDTHDLGFLYSLSCYPAVLLLTDPRAEECFLKAAHALRRRYFPQAGIIQACCSTGCTPSRTTGAWMSAPSGGTTTTWKPCSACSTAAAAIGAKSWNYPYSNPPSAPGPMWSGPSSSCWSR